MSDYGDALTAWVNERLQREDEDPGTASEVVIDSMTEGGTCGEGTCWYEGEVELSYRYVYEDHDIDERRTMLCGLNPAQFVESVCKLLTSATTTAKQSSPESDLDGPA